MSQASSLKEKIFHSAWQIVENEGMDQLTIPGIAELSECSLGSIYTVFDNFQDLQLRINAHILSRLYQTFNETTSKAFEKNKSFKELLRDLGKAYLEFGQKHRLLWKALFEHTLPAPFPDWYVKHTHEGLYFLSKKIASAFSFKEEEMRKSLGFFWASIHGVCSILLNKKLEMVAGFFNPDVHLDPYIEYCLQGLPDSGFRKSKEKPH